MKMCPRCQTRPSPREKDRKANSFCGVCRKAYAHEHYETHKSVYKDRSKSWRENNRERHNAIVRKFNRTAHGKRKRQEYSLRFAYGIEVKVFDALLKRQKGLCGICNRLLEKPHIDHNHRTGRVRGLLCSSCNMGLGLMQDSMEVLSSAIAYLAVDGMCEVVNGRP